MVAHHFVALVNRMQVFVQMPERLDGPGVIHTIAKKDGVGAEHGAAQEGRLAVAHLKEAQCHWLFRLLTAGPREGGSLLATDWLLVKHSKGRQEGSGE